MRTSASQSSHNLSAPNAGTERSSPRPRAASAAPAPTPTLDALLDMTPGSISSLSVHALKEILFKNHVNPGPVLEKSDLVKKVVDLVDDERRERQRQREAEEQEERERIEQQRFMMEEYRRKEQEKSEEAEKAKQADASSHADSGAESSSAPPPLPPKAQAMASHLERTGLCVICQDNEANMAIVDCGFVFSFLLANVLFSWNIFFLDRHLAMCRGCADLVMASSRECPLCRTRIVTDARLLRIFKS